MGGNNENMKFNDPQYFDDPQASDDPKGISIGSMYDSNSSMVEGQF